MNKIRCDSKNVVNNKTETQEKIRDEEESKYHTAEFKWTKLKGTLTPSHKKCISWPLLLSAF